ncbi:MAG: hypothetical protein DPW09_43870 [Anaerolineae bacterium]|nr:hypothetical protein [Anaerolineales bacterium]MCQ3980400.1 hypothetical protein [Anaerolineae bacterium]
MNTMLTYLEKLARETEKPEAEVMTLAIQSGLRQLWREHILSQFLRGKISRSEAIEAVGIDWVELAERQHNAMLEDLAWALAE